MIITSILFTATIHRGVARIFVERGMHKFPDPPSHKLKVPNLFQDS